MIPYDATQHIQGISQGAANAMPSITKAIENGKPGSPTLQRYIDEFEMRVGKGENPKAVGDDLFGQWENDIRNGVQHADVNVPDVGFNNGTPALGNAGAPPMNPIAQAPNSFGGGSFNGLTPPPSNMGGGISGNAGGTAPPVNFTPQGALPADNMGASVTGEKVSSIPNTQEEGPMQKVNFTEKGEIPAMQTRSIDLTKGRPQSMDTVAPPAPPRKMMNRGEQEQAMSDIERVKKLEASDGGLQFKRDKLELESKIKILKAMSNRLSDQEKLDLMRTLKTEGMTLQAQIAVMNATIRAKNAEDLNKTRQESNRIKANASSDKMDPRVQHLWVRYKAAVDEIARYNTSLVGGKHGNPERVKQLKMIAANELHEYNKKAIEMGLPERTAQDLKVPEVYGDNDPNNKVEE